MSNKDKPFIVQSEKAFGALKYWLKERGCNTYSYSRLDIINVGYDTKPDSDWGGRYEPRGYIIIKDKALIEPTRRAIEKAYGWPAKESAA